MEGVRTWLYSLKIGCRHEAAIDTQIPQSGVLSFITANLHESSVFTTLAIQTMMVAQLKHASYADTVVYTCEQ